VEGAKEVKVEGVKEVKEVRTPSLTLPLRKGQGTKSSECRYALSRFTGGEGRERGLTSFTSFTSFTPFAS
jgi:hypothetical protein